MFSLRKLAHILKPRQYHILNKRTTWEKPCVLPWGGDKREEGVEKALRIERKRKIGMNEKIDENSKKDITEEESHRKRERKRKKIRRKGKYQTKEEVTIFKYALKLVYLEHNTKVIFSRVESYAERNIVIWFCMIFSFPETLIAPMNTLCEIILCNEIVLKKGWKCVVHFG